jgi:hypothetical protein
MAIAVKRIAEAVRKDFGLNPQNFKKSSKRS